MAFATILAAALALIGFGAWRLLAQRQMALGNWVGVVALAVWLVVVGAMKLFERPPGRSELVQSLDSLAWPVAEKSPARPATVATAAGETKVPPVESLITGLEARLAAEPNDANGWALLAQSYAYTANEEAVARAVRRAVELGVDERELTERVTQAQKSAHPDWGDRAVQQRRAP